MSQAALPSLRTVAQTIVAAGLVYAAYLLLRAFLLPALTAVIIALVVRPFYKRLVAATDSAGFSAFLTVALLVTLLLIPLGALSYLIAKEAVAASVSLQGADAQFEALGATANQIIGNLGLPGLPAIDLQAQALHLLSLVAAHSTGLVGSVLGFVGSTVLTLFGVFYLLEGLPRAKTYLQRVAPFAPEDTRRLIGRVEDVVQATVRGNVIVVALQGSLFTVGCLIFGISTPLLLGALFGLASLVPVIGTSVVWLPLALYALLHGKMVAALGISLWALLEVIIIDHLIAPRIIGKRAGLHPFLALLGVLGGIDHFGLLGFILGPTILALALVSLELLGQSWLAPTAGTDRSDR